MRSSRNVSIDSGIQSGSHLCAEWRREHSIVPRVDRPEHGDSRQDDLVGELLTERLHPQGEAPAGKGIVPRRHSARIHDLLVSLVHAVIMPMFAQSRKCSIAQSDSVHLGGAPALGARVTTKTPVFVADSPLVHLCTRANRGPELLRPLAYFYALHHPLLVLLGALGAQQQKSQVDAGSVHLTVHLIRHPTQVHRCTAIQAAM